MIKITLIAYAILVLVSVTYTIKELFMMFKVENEQLKRHRLTHIVILLILILFNVSLVLTDTRDGIDSFLKLLENEVVLMQYQFMCLFLYFAGIHLSEEVTTLEEYYSGR